MATASFGWFIRVAEVFGDETNNEGEPRGACAAASVESIAGTVMGVSVLGRVVNFVLLPPLLLLAPVETLVAVDDARTAGLEFSKRWLLNEEEPDAVVVSGARLTSISVELRFADAKSVKTDNGLVQ